MLEPAAQALVELGDPTRHRLDVAARSGQFVERGPELVEIAAEGVGLLAACSPADGVADVLEARRETVRELLDAVRERLDLVGGGGEGVEGGAEVVELAAQAVGLVACRRGGEGVGDVLQPRGEVLVDRLDALGKVLDILVRRRESVEARAQRVEVVAERVGLVAARRSSHGVGDLVEPCADLGSELVDALPERPDLRVEIAFGATLLVEPLGEPLQRRPRFGRPVGELLEAAAELRDGVTPLLGRLGQRVEPRRERGELVAELVDGLVRQRLRRGVLVLVLPIGGRPRPRLLLRRPDLRRRLVDGRRRVLRNGVGGDPETGVARARRRGLRRVLEARGLVIECVPQAQPREPALRHEDLAQLAAAVAFAPRARPRADRS